jgi:hypothetical protein
VERPRGRGRIGYTAINTQDIWKDHPEKVCAFLGEFADKNPRTVIAVCKALQEASVWLDDMKNRPEQAELVSKPTYINCPKELILGRMQGHYDFGDGRKKDDPNYMIFSSRNCNYPQPNTVWWLTHSRWDVADTTRLQGRRQAGHAHRHLRDGEGDGREARRPRQQAGDAVRRHDLQPRQARGVRAVVPDQEPQGVKDERPLIR